MHKWSIFILFFVLMINLQCIRNNNISYDMILVKEGSFLMGNDDGEFGEKPQHPVMITRSFYIGKYEVTFDLYDKFCSDVGLLKLPDYNWGRGERPVIADNFYNILKFCNWLSIRHNLKPAYIFVKQDTVRWDKNANGYRLPTEAEWEFAARGGNLSKGYKYSGSDNFIDVAWTRENSDGKTHPVGQKNPNELGLYDMSGNVYEWCWDDYNQEYYKYSPVKDPVNEKVRFTAAYPRTERGGAFNSSNIALKVFHRAYIEVYPSTNNAGFRLVRNVK